MDLCGVADSLAEALQRGERQVEKLALVYDRGLTRSEWCALLLRLRLCPHVRWNCRIDVTWNLLMQVHSVPPPRILGHHTVPQGERTGGVLPGIWDAWTLHRTRAKPGGGELPTSELRL
jgi:hypothetical protein